MAAGRFACPCDKEAKSDAPKPRPWHWEASRGCGDAEAPAAVARFEGAVLMRCPARLVEPWAWDVLWLHQCMEAGMLPDSGGVMAQSATFLDAMRVVGAALTSERERAEKRADADARARAAAAKHGAGRR